MICLTLLSDILSIVVRRELAMRTIVDAGLGNAAAVALLAIVAWLVSRLGGRPAWAHCAWLLVLLKLVTPPLVSVPLAWPTRLAAAAPVIEVARPPAPPAFRAPEPPEEVEFILADLPADFAAELDEPEAPSGEKGAGTFASLRSQSPFPLVIQGPIASAPIPILTSTSVTIWPRLRSLAAGHWRLAVASVWGAGSAAWLICATTRVRRFRRVLRLASPAPAAVQARSDELAHSLGLRQGPRVWVIPGVVSPLLWAFGEAPRVIVPSGLWGRLDDRQRDTLLVHELAHLRRRDHWVRLLELLATALYWWHPVAWWARRALRQAEEQCCDAWVVWALPGAARSYATALIETVDFLSESRPVVPLAASGAGPVDDLKERLTMILQGAPARSLTPAGRLAVLGLAIALLPLLPTAARSAADEFKAVPVALNFAAVAEADDDKKEDEAKAKLEAEKAEELDKKAEELDKKAEAQASKIEAQAEAIAAKVEAQVEAIVEQAEALAEKAGAEAEALGEKLGKQAADLAESLQLKALELSDSALKSLNAHLETAQDDDDLAKDTQSSVKKLNEQLRDRTRGSLDRAKLDELRKRSAASRAQNRHELRKPLSPEKQAQVDKARAELKDAEQKLTLAVKRLAELEGHSQFNMTFKADSDEGTSTMKGLDGHSITNHARPSGHSADAKDGDDVLVIGEDGKEKAKGDKVKEEKKDKKERRREARTLRRVEPPKPPEAPVPPTPPSGDVKASASDQEKRLAELEKKLDRLMEALEKKGNDDN
jgi:bla regulator protein BlaR1